MNTEKINKIILAGFIIWASVLIILIISILIGGLDWILLYLASELNIQANFVFLVTFLFVIILLLATILFSLTIAHMIKDLKKSREKMRKEIQQIKEESKEEKNHNLLFLEIAQNLSSALGKQKLMQLILNSFIKFTQTSEESSIGYLLCYSYQSGKFEYQIGYDIEASAFSKLELSFSEGIISELARKKEILLFENIETKHLFIKKERMSLLGLNTFLVSIPLILENELRGIVNLFLSAPIYQLLKEKKPWLSLLSHLSSVALGSAMQSELAIIDRLTELYNHSHFQICLEQEIKRCIRYKSESGLLMLDIDHFKSVNDTYGHSAGDTVLRHMGKILKEQSRFNDICGRYGGEEFTIILPSTDIKGATRKANVLREVIEKYNFPLSNSSIKITVSIGVVSFAGSEDKEISRIKILNQVDKQLYRAKKEGRNKVCF